MLLLSCLGQESMKGVKGVGLNLSYSSYSQGNPRLPVIFRSLPIANPVIRFCSRGQPNRPRNARGITVRGTTGYHVTCQ